MSPDRGSEVLHHPRFKAELTRGGPDCFHSTMGLLELLTGESKVLPGHVIFKADDSFGRLAQGLLRGGSDVPAGKSIS